MQSFKNTKSDTTDTLSWHNKRAALVIGHPGHELRAYHWFEQAQPLTFVFTDGSGGGAEARIQSTQRILKDAGGKQGSLFGRFPDRKLYRLIMDQRTDVFTSVIDELADQLVTHDIEYIVGDAEEGFNSTHELCRLIIGATVEKIRNTTGRTLPNYDFLLIGHPADCTDRLDDQAIRLHLDDAALNRKLAAAHDYPELAEEVDSAIAAMGIDAFRTEVLRPVPTHTAFQGPSQKPYYETYGEEQVQKGRYTSVLRWDTHLKPIADALWQHSHAS